jgi:hypothetical protein
MQTSYKFVVPKHHGDCTIPISAFVQVAGAIIPLREIHKPSRDG